MKTRSRRYIPSLLAAMALLGQAACGGGSSSGASNDLRANQPPLARIAVSAAEGFAPLTVDFSADASSDPDGTITSFQWDFGDDSEAATGASASHTFAATGTFTVTLTVTDDGGLTASAAEPVRVRGATVSGVIGIAASSSIDSDVNDRLTTPVSNNGFGDAQAVGNPLRLGGFVNRPGTGAPDGNFRDSGDTEDIFTVELEGDERIVLSIGDPSGDLDLELYDDAAQPQLVDASISQNPGADPTEDLAAPDVAGRYFVRVVAVSGASTYVLSIDDDVASLGLPRRAKRLTDPFVAGEVLMTQSRRAMPKRYGIRPAHAGRGMRLEALDRAEPAAPGPTLPEVALPAGAAISPAALARYQTLLAARQLGARKDVEVAELNVLRQPLRVPNDPLYPEQWHFRAIDLDRAWDVTTGTAVPPVVVAVVDTGVLLDHPDLRNRLLRDGSGRVIGYDFIQDAERSNDGDGIDPDPDDPGDDEFGPGAGSFHGTHVAGTLAAQSDNGIGVAGVSWGARIMPLRVLGIDGGTTFDVLQAVRYAAGLSNISGTTPAVRADIVNLSLGSDFYSEAEQQALNEVRARGVFVVASAGNESGRVPSYPAAYDGVVAVTATTRSGTLASYSNFGPHVDVAAPGGDGGDGVASTTGTGGGGNVLFDYAFQTGTSMAAPHVSGVIALMKALHPPLTPALFDILLRNGRLTTDAGPSGRDDRFGWGIINAYQAVLAASDLDGRRIDAVISASVETLDFQAFTRQLEFAVTNLGDQSVAIAVTDDAPWLKVTPVDTTDDGFGRYRATVDRSNLADGTYRATIRLAARNRELALPVDIEVIMQVVSPDPGADAGQHYVILTSPSQDQSLAAQVVTARNGEYVFDLQDVPPGQYRVFAGTDLDDDDFICDGGEACGAYPSLSGPEVITIDPHQQPEVRDLTFATEFRTTATTTSAGADGNGLGGKGLRTAKPDENP